MHEPSRAPSPHGLQTVAGLALALTMACTPDHPTEPAAKCDGASADLSSLELYEGRTVRGDAIACIRLAENAEYIVVPQMLGATLPYAYQKFVIGDPEAPISTQPMIAAIVAGEGRDSATTAASRLHRLLREHEQLLVSG